MLKNELIKVIVYKFLKVVNGTILSPSWYYIVLQVSIIVKSWKVPKIVKSWKVPKRNTYMSKI